MQLNTCPKPNRKLVETRQRHRHIVTTHQRIILYAAEEVLVPNWKWIVCNLCNSLETPTKRGSDLHLVGDEQFRGTK